MSNSFAPILTADDEPTARMQAAELAGTIRASRPSLGFVPHCEPVLPVVARKLPLLVRVRHWLAVALLGDRNPVMTDDEWHDARVLSAVDAMYAAEKVWHFSDGFDPAPMHAWKDAQLELEHAAHARKVARGGR